MDRGRDGGMKRGGEGGMGRVKERVKAKERKGPVPELRKQRKSREKPGYGFPFLSSFPGDAVELPLALSPALPPPAPPPRPPPASPLPPTQCKQPGATSMVASSASFLPFLMLPRSP